MTRVLEWGEERHSHTGSHIPYHFAATTFLRAMTAFAKTEPCFSVPPQGNSQIFWGQEQSQARSSHHWGYLCKWMIWGRDRLCKGNKTYDVISGCRQREGKKTMHKYQREVGFFIGLEIRPGTLGEKVLANIDGLIYPNIQCLSNLSLQGTQCKYMDVLRYPGTWKTPCSAMLYPFYDIQCSPRATVSVLTWVFSENFADNRLSAGKVPPELNLTICISEN